MPDLASRIDQLVPPVPPPHFSEHDSQLVQLAFDNARQRARPFRGPFVASWLLSDFTAPLWVTSAYGREECINGEWKNAITINWNVVLPNGENLLDARYEKLLLANRAVAFLVRSGYLNHAYSPHVWRARIGIQLALSRWLVLHEQRFKPETFAFSQIDQNGIDSLLQLLAEDTWTSALQILQRLLSKYFLLTFGEPCPEKYLTSIYELPSEVRKAISEWFSSNGYYVKSTAGVYTGRRYLSRERLAREIHEPLGSLRPSIRFNAFCRQFEPDYDDPLLLNVAQSSECPDEQTPVLEAVTKFGASKGTVFAAAKTLALLLSAHHHVPDLLPKSSAISITRAREIALRKAVPDGHTPFIPVNTGLAYMREAIRIVHLYGEKIVDLYLAVRNAARTNTPTPPPISTS
ncbi:hypothetical protein SAMN05446635_8429 [Burkholderia sp. OK233]|nr:hypothetical protein SAMN05446635_8429 [Burkholderia sp. OK233]